MKRLKMNFIKYVSLNIIGMIGLSCYVLADIFNLIIYLYSYI